jgi:glutamate racemase
VPLHLSQPLAPNISLKRAGLHRRGCGVVDGGVGGIVCYVKILHVITHMTCIYSLCRARAHAYLDTHTHVSTCAIVQYLFQALDAGQDLFILGM